MIQLQNKLIKKSDSTVVFTLNFTDILTGTLDTINSYSITNGIDLDSIEINATEITVDDETIEIGKAIQLQVSAGENNNEYLVTIEVTDSEDNVIDINCIIFITKFTDKDYYGAAYYGDDYFALNSNTTAWDNATLTEKIKALNSATRNIDRLNFAGDKTDTDQILEFPRTVSDEDIGTPSAIINAAYEIALAYLDGYEDDSENRNLNIIKNQFDKVSTTYGPLVQEHLRNGIPSIVAWNYLIPYLRDVRRVDLHRVN